MPTKYYDIEDLRVGQVIWYDDFGGNRRRVRIESLHEDIKNGRSGFDGKWLNGAFEGGFDGVWGYCSQIVTVED